MVQQNYWLWCHLTLHRDIQRNYWNVIRSPRTQRPPLSGLPNVAFSWTEGEATMMRNTECGGFACFVLKVGRRHQGFLFSAAALLQCGSKCLRRTGYLLGWLGVLLGCSLLPETVSFLFLFTSLFAYYYIIAGVCASLLHFFNGSKDKKQKKNNNHHPKNKTVTFVKFTVGLWSSIKNSFKGYLSKSLSWKIKGTMMSPSLLMTNPRAQHIAERVLPHVMESP